MDEFAEKRFGYLKELDDQELLLKREEVKDEIEYLMAQLDDPKTPAQFKSEIRNSDLLFERDRLRYVEHLIKERNLSDEKKLNK